MRDFKNAAHRHYKDAEILYKKSRFANADHLYGLSAECILKRIIASLDPASVDSSTGDFLRNSSHKKHFESSRTNKDLWNHFSTTFISGRLAAHLTLPNPNPFYDWDVFQRYDHECSFNKSKVDPHRLATKTLRNKADDLYTSGII